MKTLLKVFGIVTIVLGSLALWEVLFGVYSGPGLFGGAIFLFDGILMYKASKLIHK